MTRKSKSPEKPGKDTSPLELDQLSHRELVTILEIERRLYEIQASELPRDVLENQSPYLAVAQKRDPRVLLLDGARGTGKTSMLLTLLRRWTGKQNAGTPWHDADVRAYRDKISRVREDPDFTKGDHDFDIPNHVSVVGRILDFDPLPPEMPLIAGIMQAWEPLAAHYDGMSVRRDDFENEVEPLTDLWQRLFQVAAVGWAAIPRNRGLIEQVLDRQEQVADWHRLDERWRAFVNEVIKRGRNIPGSTPADAKPVFVIMIDDVDLQVERIRELLPAIRLLYHPNVVFLVAADKAHMIHMLKLDFLGQQHKLTHGEVAPNRWAERLAYSSFEKVFPFGNQWELGHLSLLGLLDFPKEEHNLRAVLNHWGQRKDSTRPLLGDYLREMACVAEEVLELPSLMPYRLAHQAFEEVPTDKISKPDVTRAIAHLLSAGKEDLLRVTRRGQELAIDYLLIGELAALFRPGFTYTSVSVKADIVLSGRPDFIYHREPTSPAISMIGERESPINFTSAILAASLREERYWDAASDLRWNVRLALAWTHHLRVLDRRYKYPSVDLSFQWRFHEHPSPLRLLTWAKDWLVFIKGLHADSVDLVDRVAYAWIYHQLRWLDAPLNKVLDPFDKSFNTDDSWARLLDCNPGEQNRWNTQTLPLLARPEIGLTPKVQDRLLRSGKGPLDQKLLSDQRRRLVTDAIIAAEDQVGGTNKDAEDHVQVERLIGVFDRRFRDAHENDSLWWKLVEQPLQTGEDARRTPSEVNG